MRSVYAYCGFGLIMLIAVMMYTMVGTSTTGQEIDYWTVLKAVGLTGGFFGLGVGAGRASMTRRR